MFARLLNRLLEFLIPDVGAGDDGSDWGGGSERFCREPYDPERYKCRAGRYDELFYRAD